MIDDETASQFWSRISKGHGPNDCWFVLVKGVWAGSKLRPVTDYPTEIKFGRKKFYPHRLAYELAYGSIPSGLVVRHRCANGGCCNPEHLLLGTRHENSMDRMVRFRAKIEKGALATYEDLPEHL